MYGNINTGQTQSRYVDRQTECLFVDGPGQAGRWVGTVASGDCGFLGWWDKQALCWLCVLWGSIKAVLVVVRCNLTAVWFLRRPYSTLECTILWPIFSGQSDSEPNKNLWVEVFLLLPGIARGL